MSTSTIPTAPTTPTQRETPKTPTTVGTPSTVVWVGTPQRTEGKRNGRQLFSADHPKRECKIGREEGRTLLDAVFGGSSSKRIRDRSVCAEVTDAVVRACPEAERRKLWIGDVLGSGGSGTVVGGVELSPQKATDPDSEGVFRDRTAPLALKFLEVTRDQIRQLGYDPTREEVRLVGWSGNKALGPKLLWSCWIDVNGNSQTHGDSNPGDKRSRSWGGRLATRVIGMEKVESTLLQVLQFCDPELLHSGGENLLIRVLELANRYYDAGGTHGDFHPANIGFAGDPLDPCTPALALDSGRASDTIRFPALDLVQMLRTLQPQFLHRAGHKPDTRRRAAWDRLLWLWGRAVWERVCLSPYRGTVVPELIEAYADAQQLLSSALIATPTADLKTASVKAYKRLLDPYLVERSRTILSSQQHKV